MRLSGLIPFCFFLGAICLPANAGAPEAVPPFVDDTTRTINCSGLEPLQEYVWANHRGLERLSEINREVARREMIRRVRDEHYPPRLRNLAAGALMGWNEEAGREYFRRQFEKPTSNIADACWQFGCSGLYGTGPTSPPPSMSWAEPLMLGLLRNRATFSHQELFGERFGSDGDRTRVEVRELALTVGAVPRLLAQMKSRRGLALLVELINEPVPYAHDAIEVLGQFGDPTVEPLLLRTMKAEDANFRAAVHAAIDLKAKAAVPFLLERLGVSPNEDVQIGICEGLQELADPGQVPALRKKLPKLHAWERDEVRLLILRLEGGDAVPELLAMLRDPQFSHRCDVVFWLERLKDKRAVKDLAWVMNNDKDAFMRGFAIRALGAVGTREALGALVQGLEADYSNVQGFKVNADHDFKQEFQTRILEQLQRSTGQSFGPDPNAWRKWLEARR